MVAYSAMVNAFVGRDAEALRYAAVAIELGYAKDTMPLPIVAHFTALRSRRYAEAVALYANDSRFAESARLAYGALENPAQRATALAAIALLFSAAPAQSAADTEYGLPA